MFVFGSSLVDNGNNNFLEKCKAKANYLPYGVDYAKGPTGRFTNGKNVIDLLGDHLKLPSLPTFKDPSTKGNVILQGVDFASGGSGILDETGVASGEVMGMNEQIKNMQTVTLPDLENQLGCKSNEALSNYLFLVGTAGNDFSLNFFKNFPHNNATLTGFISKLITGLSQQIQRLYDMGARKFVVMSVYPNGCSPTVRARVPIPVPTGCIHTINVPLSLYNTNLKSLLDYMMQKMPDSKPLLRINIVLSSLITSPLHPIVGKDNLIEDESSGVHPMNMKDCPMESKDPKLFQEEQEEHKRIANDIERVYNHAHYGYCISVLPPHPFPIINPANFLSLPSQLQSQFPIVVNTPQHASKFIPRQLHPNTFTTPFLAPQYKPTTFTILHTICDFAAQPSTEACTLAICPTVVGFYAASEPMFNTLDDHCYTLEPTFKLTGPPKFLTKNPDMAKEQEKMVGKMKSAENAVESFLGLMCKEDVSYKDWGMYSSINLPQLFEISKFKEYDGHEDSVKYLG
ncbi:putative F-box/kelch-repeat protein-like [Capsicum annuum]|uniref:GDSL esterase/lipase n=1 Tax=Capsicum annuum TaxID=4072 RepID=A0A2G2ZNB1_CAPAN|nr:putative F-box/kelch-repeat protein-like [Capsicum annuum]PHT83477.1 hypothetical protein T459_11920 [Capsicum annuum]